MPEPQTDWFAQNAPKAPPSAPSSAAQPATPQQDWFLANAPKGDTSSQTDPLTMPTLHGLSQKTPEQEHEGLYHMKDKDGHSYAIPYSNVQAVPDWENSFSDNEELNRYKWDHAEDTQVVSVSKVRHNIAKKNIDVKKTGNFAHDYLLRPAVNTANAAGRTIVEPVVDYVDNKGMSREEKEKQGQAEWEGSVFGKAEKRDKEGAPPATAKENLKDAAQIAGDMVPIMPVGTQGRQMAHDFTHGHKMDVATDLAGLGVVAGVTHGMLKTMPTEIPSPKEAIARKLAGTGEGLTKSEIADRAAKNKEILRKNKEDYDPEYKKKVDAVEAENVQKKEEFEAAKKKRENLVDEKTKRSRTLREIQTRVHQHIQAIRDAGAKWFDGQYDTLAKETRGARVDFSPLTEAVEKEKLETIADPITKVPVFEDIIKKAKGEAGEGADARKPADWQNMSLDERRGWQEEQLSASGATYRYLLGKYRQIGKMMRSPSLDPSVRQGLANVRVVIEKMQGEAAKLADKTANHRYAEDMAEWEEYAAEHGEKKAGPKPEKPSGKAAQMNYRIGNAYRNFAQSYRDRGALGTKIAESETPTEGTKHLLKDLTDDELSDAKRTLVGKPESGGKATNATQWARRLEGENLGRNRYGNPLTQTELRQQTGELVDRLRKAQAEHDAVPDAGEAPKLELKDLPEYKAPKEKAYSEEKLKNKREEQINNRVLFFSSPSFRLGAKGLTTFGIADVVAKILGFHEGVALTAGGISALSYLLPGQIIKLLTDPAMQEKLLTITAKDRQILAKLPANQRAVVEQNIINMERVAKQQGIIPEKTAVPLANFAKTDITKAKAEAAKMEESSSGRTAEPVPSVPASAPLSVPAPVAPEPPLAPQPVAAPPPAPPAPAVAVEQPPRVAEPRNDHQPSRRLADLKVDPKRFQYKLGGNKQGVTDAMSDANWNQAYADPIHIWEDPEDGEEYVVNGHHRVDLAKSAGAERINVQKISNEEWPTAADARRFGALKNIADGNGTSVDAAKFMREKGYTVDDLRKTGLSLKKAVAKEGVALSKLSDDMFDRVVDGKVDPKIGAAIGEASDVASDQEAILKDVNRREKAGRPVTPEQIRESARLIKSSPTRTETTTDLFGDHEEERNLFLEMGEVSEYIQHELADEKRIFKRVASKGASDQLAKGKNVINPEENAKIAQQAAQQRELYLKRSAQAGPIHAALQEAAERLAEGGNPNEIKQSAFDEIRQHLAEELGHSAE